MAALTMAIWRPVHALPPEGLAVALLLSVVLVARTEHPWAPLAIASVGGLLVTGVATGDPLVSVLAAVAGGLLARLRPASPTRTQLHRIRSFGLVAPGAVLGIALTYNVVTAELGSGDPFEALGFGLGLFGLVWMGALGLWGLETLMSSRVPEQQGAWAAGCIVLAGLIGSTASSSPSGLLMTCLLAAVPAVTLAAVASNRASVGHELPPFLLLALPPGLVVLQWSLL